jgi:hypothetical protein
MFLTSTMTPSQPFSRDVLWRQFGASIDMLERAIEACPASLWGDATRQPEFWYLAFHTLFWIDFYLSESPDAYTPFPPFGMEEADPAGVMPPRTYTQEEVMRYLDHCREKCRRTIGGLSADEAAKRFVLGTLDLSREEIIPYTMRHVQHHVAQLQLILRRETGSAPGWVRATDLPLAGT